METEEVETEEVETEVYLSNNYTPTSPLLVLYIYIQRWPLHHLLTFSLQYLHII